MDIVWGILTLAPPLAVLVRYLCGRRILDGSMMLLGLAGYCFLPFFLYATDGFLGGPGEAVWAREFERLYAAGASYLALVGVLVASYVLGRLPAPALGLRLDVPISGHALGRFLVILVAIWMLLVYRARDNLLQGYFVEYRPDLMGPLATVNLAVLMAVLNLRQWRQSVAVGRWYFALLVINSVLLLSMGGRMYVAIPFISLFLQHIGTTARSPGRRISLLVVAGGVLGTLMAVGLWRLDLEFDARIFTLIAFAEPVLTSISLASYFSCQGLQVLAVPTNFLGSIVNFVPTILLPDKAQYVPSLDPLELCIEAPFGATHLGPALLANFGIVGSACFLMLFAYFIKCIRNVRPSGWWFHYYVCGLLPLLFFRDGFVIFNKALIGSGLFVAMAMIWLDQPRLLGRRSPGGAADGPQSA